MERGATRSPVSRACDGKGQREEIPSVRLYDLRHTAATLALQAGVPVQIVSRMLGHATVAFKARNRPSEGKMAPATGLEPVTRGLTVRCSTN